MSGRVGVAGAQFIPFGIRQQLEALLANIEHLPHGRARAAVAETEGVLRSVQ